MTLADLLPSLTNPAVLQTALSVVVGGLGVRSVELWFRQRGQEADQRQTAAQAAHDELREALQGQIDSLKADLRRLSGDLDYWRNRAAQLEVAHALLSHEHQDLLEELARLRRQLGSTATPTLVTAA